MSRDLPIGLAEQIRYPSFDTQSSSLHHLGSDVRVLSILYQSHPFLLQFLQLLSHLEKEKNELLRLQIAVK